MLRQRKSPSVAAPVSLSSLEAVRVLWREVNALPLKGGEKIPTLGLGAKILPDEERATLQAELERTYPTLRGVRDRLKALTLAVELLPAESRPKSFGEQVLLAMADAEA